MGQSDLRSIWGNTLRPIVLAGDVKQLPPTMMELDNHDKNGNYANRFALAGRISGLAWLQALGIPTFRLLQQMRMANDMFGIPQKLFYDDHRIVYGPGSDPALDTHAVGREFEKYLAQGKFKGYRGPTKGTLQPIFLHMPKTRIVQVGTSRLNRAQVKGALDLINDFVKKTGISPKHFVVISAHRPNVDYGNRLLNSGVYPALAGMQEVQTVDSIQGSENTVGVFVCGTSSSVESVGFISNPNRLNVSLTRQKSALLIVGDKTVTGNLTGSKAQMDTLMRQASQGKASWSTSGEASFTKSAALRELLVDLQKAGRIIEAVSEEEFEEMAAEEEKRLIAEEKVKRTLQYLQQDWKYDSTKSWADLDEEELEDF
jgi:hypothetical protein